MISTYEATATAIQMFRREMQRAGINEWEYDLKVSLSPKQMDRFKYGASSRLLIVMGPEAVHDGIKLLGVTIDANTEIDNRS